MRSEKKQKNKAQSIGRRYRRYYNKLVERKEWDDEI
jgi:hypothetical protein